jgi:hypothetical protein
VFGVLIWRCSICKKLIVIAYIKYKMGKIIVIGIILPNFHGWYWRLDLQKKIKKIKTMTGVTTWNKIVLIQPHDENSLPKPMFIMPDEWFKIINGANKKSAMIKVTLI